MIALISSTTIVDTLLNRDFADNAFHWYRWNALIQRAAVDGREFVANGADGIAFERASAGALAVRPAEAGFIAL